MKPKDLKQFLLRMVIGFFCLTAAVAIAVVGGRFGEFELKVLATTFLISAASMCALSCAAFIEKRGPRLWGVAGIAWSVVGAALTTYGLWTEIVREAFWKTTASIVTVAVAMAYACLLALRDLERRHRWVQVAAWAAISVLALQIIFGLWAEPDAELFFKLLVTVSILLVLFTLVIAVLANLRSGARGVLRTLRLVERPDGTFCDASGALYRVTKIEPGPPCEGDAAPPSTIKS